VCGALDLSVLLTVHDSLLYYSWDSFFKKNPNLFMFF
jgi:hypothetical protein